MTLHLPTSRKTTRGIQLVERRIAAPQLSDINSLNNIWWTGADYTSGTAVTVTGSQTVTEAPLGQPHSLLVVPASQSAADLNCVVWPRTISTGDAWGCKVTLATSSTNQLLLAGPIFTDGTSTTSAVAMANSQVNNNGTYYRSLRGGTLTNLSVDSGGQTSTQRRLLEYFMILQYTASNSYTALVATPEGYVIGSIYIDTMGPGSITLTPTHVGVGWTVWGTSPVAAQVKFGPLIKVA